MFITFLNIWKTVREKEYATDIIYGLQSLKYLLSGPFTENNNQLLVYLFYLVSWNETDVTLKKTLMKGLVLAFHCCITNNTDLVA